MGDRAYIQIESERLELPILLYGHYAGVTNLEAVKTVLARTSRIGDPSYLAAQIFYEFAIVQGNYDGELGFGLDTGVLTDSVWVDNPTVYLNADTGEYTYDGVSYDEYAKVELL